MRLGQSISFQVKIINLEIKECKQVFGDHHLAKFNGTKTQLGGQVSYTHTPQLKNHRSHNDS